MIRRCKIVLLFVGLLFSCKRPPDPVHQKIDKILHSEFFTFGYMPLTSCLSPAVRVYYSKEKNDSIYFVIDTLRLNGRLFDQAFKKEVTDLVRQSCGLSDQTKYGRLYTLQNGTDTLRFFCNDRASVLKFGRLFGFRPRNIDSICEMVSQKKKEKYEAFPDPGGIEHL